MRRFRRIVIGLVLAAAALAIAGPPSADRSGKQSRATSGSDRAAIEIAFFVYDAVARVNEGLVSNIDAIDSALTGILAGALAAVLFMVDKLAGLPPTIAIFAMLMFSCSVVVCALGYFVGFWSAIRNRDGIRPRRFIGDVAKHPDEAILAALKVQVDSGEANMTIRLCKRVLALAALVLLIAGVVSIAVARLPAFVVW